ncbi:MAG: class I SAM-dependent methyltransferase [Planctomycetes bacterium]|nr:class I SAM-dependent methyltransferase [Planctomycetota bacterium]
MPTRDENRKMWNELHDWTDLGEIWTPHADWKVDVLRWTIERYLKRGLRVLELGPGGGRWTQELLKYEPRHIVLVDIARKCVDLCKQRFADAERLELFVNDGRTLPFIEDASIDFIWSFDCLVHVDREDIQSYFKEFRRVLAPGGIIIIHYPTIDRATDADKYKGWRSDFTFDDMVELVTLHKFKGLDDIYNGYIAHSNTSIAIIGADEACKQAPYPKITPPKL